MPQFGKENSQSTNLSGHVQQGIAKPPSLSPSFYGWHQIYRFMTNISIWKLSFLWTFSAIFWKVDVTPRWKECYIIRRRHDLSSIDRGSLVQRRRERRRLSSLFLGITKQIPLLVPLLLLLMMVINNDFNDGEVNSNLDLVAAQQSVAVTWSVITT